MNVLYTKAFGAKHSIQYSDAGVYIMDTTEQKRVVDELYQLLYKQKDQVEETKHQIQEEVRKLQVLCAKKGHIYVRYSDEDYHRPSYYYVCDVCKHYTTRNPSSPA